MDKKEVHPYCNCLYYSVNALSRVITKMAEEEFRITGLAPSYAFVMMTINNNDGLNIGKVADIMQLTPSTVTRLIEKLEYKGYLRREQEGRSILIYATDKGKKLKKDIQLAWSNLYKRYAEVLGEEYSTELSSKIFSAREALESE